MAKIIIAGGSGLVGGRLTQKLENDGHQVQWLTRNSCRDGNRSIAWDPANGKLEHTALEGADAIINLAGAGIADQRWNEARKREILDSRILSTRLLVETIGRLHHKPRVLVNASAHGYYAPSLNEPCDENGPPGDNFLADVCKHWEGEAQNALNDGLRLAIVRISVVLDPEGGALAKMLPPFRMGVGGPAGTGRQRISWIHRDDLVALLSNAVHDHRYEGIINAVAPEPISNAEFATTLGQALKRPAITPAPAFALKLAFGEMAEQTILADLGVISRRLPELGFQWQHPELSGALSDLLN